MTVTPTPDSATGSPLPAPQLALSVHVDVPQQIDALMSDPLFQQRGHAAKTLVDAPDLRVLLVALRAGRRIGEQAPGSRISIETLVGSLMVKLGDEAVVVPLGHLVAFDKGIAHEVEAIQDCAFLVSLSGFDPRAEPHPHPKR